MEKELPKNFYAGHFVQCVVAHKLSCQPFSLKIPYQYLNHALKNSMFFHQYVTHRQFIYLFHP